ncbi:MAG: sel1 repeat family protein [Proteobacteria bacterium]|nr:sel1 repeat family protein [Pseudomonadota bacterium]NOG60791.1 sel1 repeat family protein [Pseudomonadota bacterium]
MKTSRLLLSLLFAYPLFGYADFKDGGDAYINGDYETAANEFIPLAERGDHRAMYALGSMYSAGQGVEKNLKKAYELFYEAAKNGRADAMHKLGLMYEQGTGVKQNNKKALRYYQKSAKLGYSLAQYNFGLMYMNGTGVKQNPVKAYAWLVVAAHQFIYEYASDEHVDIENFKKHKKYYLLLVQQQEKDKILNDITKHLQAIKANMSAADIEQTRQKVIKYSQYRWKHRPVRFKDVPIESDIENLFLPETLY